MSRTRKAQAAEIARTGRPFDWLIGILLSWLLPLGLLFDFEVTYFNSLLLWAVPIAFLVPRFLLLAHPTRRRAFWFTAGLIAVLGLILDFILGTWILCFDGEYVATLPSLGGKRIPIEEVLFYILGAWAVLLVYVWCDEYWLRRYSVRASAFREEPQGPLIGFSRRWAIVAVLLLAAGTVVKALLSTPGPVVPIYFSFLVVVAFAPAIVAYRAVRSFVNWQAFSWTSLYVLLTSCIWEVTLALPREWWGYEENATFGRFIQAWSTKDCARFPIEALLVWLAVSFASVVYYEFFRAVSRDQRPLREVFLPTAVR